MRTRIAILAATLAIVPAADAQTAGDVVVMRRQVAPAVVRDGTWTTGAPVANVPSCSATAPATAPVTCMVAGLAVDAARCKGTPPDGRTTLQDWSGCTYDKVLGAYTNYDSSCSNTPTRTRTNSCLRQPGGTQVDPATFCGIPAYETDVATGGFYTGCTGTWGVTWTDAGACANNVKPQTSSVTCTKAGTCDPRSRPAPAASRNEPCSTKTVSCGMTRYREPNNASSPNTQLGTHATYAAALAACEQADAITTGICWIRGSGSAWKAEAYGRNAGTYAGQSDDPNSYAGLCVKQ